MHASWQRGRSIQKHAGFELWLKGPPYVCPAGMYQMHDVHNSGIDIKMKTKPDHLVYLTNVVGSTGNQLEVEHAAIELLPEFADTVEMVDINSLVMGEEEKRE